MKQSDLKLLKNGSFAIGLLSILFGFIAYFYEERQYWGYWVVYPYREYAFPLLFLGIVFLALGLVASSQFEETKEKAEKQAEPRETGKFFCRYCGAINKRDAVFCGTCGKKFSE